MNILKISVIVPVYNVEKYIEECIESILNQTLKDIEIIIVNDGTKDNSMKKVEKYLSDSRIIVINKENGGLSSARNAGLKIAKGKYISFVDSDDFIDKNMLRDLFYAAEECDIVSSEMILYNNITHKMTKRIREKSFFQGKGSFLYKMCGMEVCNKIYKRNFLFENNIFFEEGIIHEDNLFTLKAFFMAKNVKYIEKYHYFYRIKREKSILNTLVLDRRKQSFEIILKEILKFENTFSGNKFDQIRLMLAKLEQKSLLYRITYDKKDSISINEINYIENKLKKNWDNFSSDEKFLLRKDMIDLLESKAYYNVNLFNFFYWKNRMMTQKALRRIIKGKIINEKNIMY